MSIKAVKRRAREARYWLGQCCLPLWADAGLVRGEGFVAALDMNHRAPDDPVLADALGQAAMADLFKLGPRVGFAPDRSAELFDLANRHTVGTPPAPPMKPAAGEKSLSGQCADLRARLLAFADDDSATAEVIAGFDALMDEFLTPEGGWIAGYTANGQPSRKDIPAYLGRDLVRALAPLIAIIEA